MLIPANFTPYTAQQMTDLLAALDTIESIIAPTAILVPPDETNKFVKLGDTRSAAVPLVIQAALAHPNAFPPDTFDVANLQKAEEFRTQLSIVQSRLQSLEGMVDDTRMVAGSEVISKTLQGYSQLQNAAKFIAGLTEVVRDIGQALRRKSVKTKTPAA